MVLAVVLILISLLAVSVHRGYRPTLALLAVATVTLGYVFGHTFWNMRLGPLPVTIDRLLLGMTVFAAGWYVWKQRTSAICFSLVDWAVIGTLVWLTASALAGNFRQETDLPVSPYWRLLFSFWLPALLYFVVRLAPISSQQTTRALVALTVLGCYLGVTAIAEATGQWWAVFPRYLSDPTLGTHFGRARGPALNSVSLGTYLSMTFWAAWTLRSRVTRGWQVAILSGMVVMTLAVFLTYTRSVWMGAALSGLVMLIADTPREYRKVVAGSAMILGLLVAAVGWNFVMQLDREDSGQVSQHSVQQRTAFAYVSWNMFCDEPLAGVGFGRFYDKKLPYLSDRSQSFELESIRGLHHHNTALGLLVETGVVGLAAYLAILLGWFRTGWQMAFSYETTEAAGQMGRLLLAVLAVYLPSFVFHDITHIFQDQWLLFLFAGVAVATAEQAGASAAERQRVAPSYTWQLATH